MQQCLQTNCLTRQHRPDFGRKPLKQFSPAFQPRQTGRRQIARARPQRDTQRRTEVPSAPPVQTSPPTPPPPGSPDNTEGYWNPDRRDTLRWILGCATVSFISHKVRNRVPAYRSEDGRPMLRSKGGVPINIDKDTDGNIWFTDPRGNMYYDTGSMGQGMYVIQKDGTLTNLFMDNNFNPRMIKLGNIKDLRDIKIKDIGGVPIEKIQAEFAQMRSPDGKRLKAQFPDHILAFPDENEPEEFPPGVVQLEPEKEEEMEDGRTKIKAKVKFPREYGEKTFGDQHSTEFSERELRKLGVF